MTNITNAQDTDLVTAAMQNLGNRFDEVADKLYATSKEKYDLKNRLIENAADMTTQEKLDAIDLNYDRHNQEVWQNILIAGFAALGLIGLASGNPTIIKNIRRLAA